jgi:hypothetical protein
MDGPNKALSIVAAASLAISSITLFALPLPGASCAIVALLLPGFGFLILFGYRDRWRRFKRWVEEQPDEPPP